MTVCWGKLYGHMLRGAQGRTPPSLAGLRLTATMPPQRSVAAAAPPPLTGTSVSQQAPGHQLAKDVRVLQGGVTAAPGAEQPPSFQATAEACGAPPAALPHRSPPAEPSGAAASTSPGVPPAGALPAGSRAPDPGAPAPPSVHWADQQGRVHLPPSAANLQPLPNAPAAQQAATATHSGPAPWNPSPAAPHAAGPATTETAPAIASCAQPAPASNPRYDGVGGAGAAATAPLCGPAQASRGSGAAGGGGRRAPRQPAWAAQRVGGGSAKQGGGGARGAAAAAEPEAGHH